MNIQMPDGKKIELEENIGIKEKCEVTRKLIEEYIDYIDRGWETSNVIYFLNGLSNYLVWHKEEGTEYIQDKEVLGKRKTKELSKYKEKNIQFSILSEKDKMFLGLSDMEEMNYD